MTTVTAKNTEIEEGIYWGPQGEYGPFREQKEGPWEGWPDFGQVLRRFREKAKMSQTEFAEIYGKNFNKNERPLTRMQVNRMELHNQVPEDRSKRVFLANLLNIPPILLGMATLETVTLKPGTTATIMPSTLTRVSIDLAKYQTTVHTLTSLQYTGPALSQITPIQKDIQELESLEIQARGDLLYHIQENLFSYHLLVTKVARDRRKFDLSYHHANQMVRIAKATQDTDLIATALYIRGRTYLTWGRAGILERGVYQVQVDKINKAIRDLQNAKRVPEIHPQLLGLINIYISWAYAILQGEKASSLVIPTLDNIYEENVGHESIDDPHTRILITGSRLGLIEGEYLNMRATILNAIKAPDKALEALMILKNLQQGKIGKEYTSHQTWIQTVEANTLIELGNYSKAVKLIRLALGAYKDINNADGLADLVDIHGRLLQSPYKNASDVRELGDQLRMYIPQNTHQIQGEQDY